MPRIRRAPIPDDASLVVRGDDLDPSTARTQAEAFRDRFPDWARYGISAYFARSDAEIDDLAADQLERFPSLLILSHVELVRAGFDVVPTFRSPHVTIAFGGDVDERLAALGRLRVEVRTNPYHDREP